MKLHLKNTLLAKLSCYTEIRPKAAKPRALVTNTSTALHSTKPHARRVSPGEKQEGILPAGLRLSHACHPHSEVGAS